MENHRRSASELARAPTVSTASKFESHSPILVMILPSMILPFPLRFSAFSASLRFFFAVFSPRLLLFLLLACLVNSPAPLLAQFTTFSQQVEADTFVSSGEPDSNFGIQAGMEIAGPTLAQPRTQKALLRFNTAAMHAAFDADYGAGNWAVTGVTLSLFSNYATAGVQPANSRFNKIAAGS